MIQVAVEAAREGGKFLIQNLGKVGEIRQKAGQEKNLVTEIDKRSEEIVIDIIRKHYPQHDILAEESGSAKGRASDYRWVIDPLDGTTNFTHGFPAFCVSIGLEVKGELLAGAIYDPNADEMFTAEKGKGAFLNGKRIHVSPVSSLRQSLMITGFPYNVADNPNHAIEHFVNFILDAQGVRRMGSAALDLAYVAAGRCEGFWEVSLNPWDMAAGGLLVMEAGGKLSDFSGKPFSIYRKEIAASNGLVHDQMLTVLKSAY